MRVQRLRSRRGQSAVELALVLPLLFVVIFGAIEFGTAMYDKAVVTNASREAARAAIVGTTPRLSDAGVQGVAHNYSGHPPGQLQERHNRHGSHLDYPGSGFAHVRHRHHRDDDLYLQHVPRPEMAARLRQLQHDRHDQDAHGVVEVPLRWRKSP